MGGEDVPENVVENVAEETPTLLNVKVTKPVTRFTLYTLLLKSGSLMRTQRESGD